MRDVFWSEAALADLTGIIDDIAADNPKGALSVIERIEETGNGLGEMAIGRPGRVGGTYERVIAGLPYILAYAMDRRSSRPERIVILRVIHGRRD